MTDPHETAHEHRRRSIRLHGYDYSHNGAYFVTICARNREHLFGKIENGILLLNDAGRMIDRWWRELKNRFPNIELDAFIVMPNHIHGIIVIKNDPVPVGAAVYPRPFPNAGSGPHTGTDPHTGPGHPQGAPLRENIKIGITIGNIVGAFKSLTMNEYIRRVNAKEFPRFEKSIWQRNYYERIIRDDGEWNAIREYIEKNPEMWGEDEMYG